jgi:hypothetical protein
MKLKAYILFFFLLCAGSVLAQVRFQVNVERTEVGVGEAFQVEFDLNAQGDRFTPPNFNGFAVVGGPNQSSGMTIINGKTTVNMGIGYVLSATKEGEYTIGPATIYVNGKEYATAPVKIKVGKARTNAQRQQAQQQAQQQAMDNLASNADISKDLFLKATVDKENVYQGQQFSITYSIYTRIPIMQTGQVKLPDLTGFWNQDVTINPQQKQVPWHVQVYKGVRYNVADVKQVILFPEHSGTIKIDPWSMDMVVRVAAPAKDIMDQFFGGAFEDKKITPKSEPLTIHVRPLPEAGKPASFMGAVGNFSIQSSIDKTSLKTNEALNYKISVTGSGNIKLLKDLNPNFSSDFEKYDPKIADSVKVNLSGVSGTRYYSYLLIPRHGGDYKIDPVKFSYFNPNTGKYVSLETKSFEVKVAKGANEANVTSIAGDKQDVKILDKDIRFIKTNDTGLAQSGEGFYGSMLYYLLLLLGPVLCLAAYILRNVQQARNADVVKVKNRRAGRIAAKHLANAQKQLAAKNTAAFYEAIFRGLYGYLADKLNIDYGQLDKPIIADTLQKRGAEQRVIDALLETLDLCEMARYAPVTNISEQQVYNKAKGVISDIENEI